MQLNNSSGFHFGLDPHKVAVHLRTLADKIEAKDIVLEGIDKGQQIDKDDFWISYLTLSFHEKTDDL